MDSSSTFGDTLEKLEHATQAAFVIPKPGMYSSVKTNTTPMPKPTLFSMLIYIVVKIEKECLHIH